MGERSGDVDLFQTRDCIVLGRRVSEMGVYARGMVGGDGNACQGGRCDEIACVGMF